MDQLTNNISQEGLKEEPINIKLIDIRTVNDLINVLNNALNKAVTNGSYTMDEAFQFKLSINTLTKAIETLEKDQAVLVKLSKKESTSQGGNVGSSCPDSNSALGAIKGARTPIDQLVNNNENIDINIVDIRGNIESIKILNDALNKAVTN